MNNGRMVFTTHTGLGDAKGFVKKTSGGARTFCI